MAKDKPSKYKAKKIVIDGIKFDSIAESEYYTKLKNAKAFGIIKNFKVQPVFILQDKFTHETGKIRAITYRADFLIHQLGEDRPSLVIDVKGKATADAKNKRKMFLKRYHEFELLWEAKSIKYRVEGCIDYFTLEKIRRENRKKKAKK